MNTLRTVQQLLVEEFGVQNDQVAPETRFSELGVDSLARMEFMFLLEEHFGLMLSELPPETVATVGGLAEHIDLLLAQQRSPAHEDATVDR